MLDFIPFMIVAAIVILVVAGLGAYRSGLLGQGGLADMERLEDAEQEFADCLREHGHRPLDIQIYRDPADGNLVLVGRGPIPDDMVEAFGDCDRRISAIYRRTPDL